MKSNRSAWRILPFVCLVAVGACRQDMPTFQGLISEDQLLQLIAYVKSLGAGGETAPQPATQTPAGSATTPAPGAQPSTPPGK